MNYQQTIDYLYQQLPMFSRIGAAAYKKDLHNTVALCGALDNPHKKFKSIHIAGTNGKGSTSHMLAALLQQAGYKTGLYTSPHLKDFRERIKINGDMIEENFVVDFVERTRDITAQIEPSFFELTVVMAFEYFAQQQVDIAVIETGLGGRLDSTNVVTPVLSIITNIGYDHMNLLGNTLQEIAGEKAGIIKPHVPVVIGEYLPETKTIFLEKAKACNAPIYFASDTYAVSDIHTDIHALHCKVTDTTCGITEDFTLDLNGLYQTKNLCTVLQAEGILMENGFKINNDAEKYACAHVKSLTGLHGRWEVIAENPVTVMDVAHNEDGIKQVLQQLQFNGIAPEQTHFVIGMVKDKDINKVLSLLPSNANYYFTHAHIPRALSAEQLLLKAKGYHLQGAVYDDVNAAIQFARNKAAAGDVVVICGSVFLVGEVNV
ncbi:MAG: bifunctional folylpolyglutamate synthase/dihydrofolate synthase [Bacteroidetes bacterium]|nr:bifunctional folylpolyglutamate synthase/dihydrofolate synthase [Bacteroidota bacterium]